MDWNDELRERVKKEYLAANPTPETTIEISAEISKNIIGSTANGVRLLLTKMKDEDGKSIYIPTDNKEKAAGTKRVNKADAIKALKDIISKNMIEVDDAIVDKLTGKAAVYFTTVMTKLIDDEEDDT
mgnify:CR=1 FL=1